MKNVISEEKVNEFLQELGKLSKKYGIEIAGCGCCGSPSLNGFEGELFEDGYLYKTNLSYNYEKGIYEVDCEG